MPPGGETAVDWQTERNTMPTEERRKYFSYSTPNPSRSIVYIGSPQCCDMNEATTAKVLQIDPNNISPNRENPRLIFYTENLEILKTSIQKNGILVPITVFKKPNEQKWTILDGERRWRCAQKLKLKKIPANQIPLPSKRQNILLMFNIHKVRDEWELVPTALKLQVLMNMMPEATQKELSRMTGMTTPRIKNCIRILRFPQKYLDLTLIADKSRRIKGEFFSQLEEALEKLSENDFKSIDRTREQIIDIMIDKYQKGEFTNLISEFRTLRKVITSPKKGAEKKVIHQSIRNYLDSKPSEANKKLGQNIPMSVTELYEKTTYNIDIEDVIINTSEKLNKLLFDFDINQIQNKEKIRKTLEELRETINLILRV